jgi:hypothetical protein
MSAALTRGCGPTPARMKRRKKRPTDVIEFYK